MPILVANVVECLRELCDAEFQRRVWVAGVGPEVSSFSELVSQLFDDTGLGDSIEDGTLANELGEAAASKLLDLDAAIEDLDHSLTPDRLVDHPAMARVRDLAAESLSLLGV